MTSIWQAPAVVLAFIGWLSAPLTDLGEIARREAVRRQLTAQSVGSFTNQDLPPAALVVGPEPVAPPTDPQAAAAAAAPAPPEPAAQPAPEDPRKTEAYWRNRIEQARSALERDQVLLDAMQARINALNTDVVNIDDPAQQGALRTQLQRALDEFDRLKKQIDAGTQAIKDIQTEARKARVPPGWIR